MSLLDMTMKVFKFLFPYTLYFFELLIRLPDVWNCLLIQKITPTITSKKLFKKILKGSCEVKQNVGNLKKLSDMKIENFSCFKV